MELWQAESDLVAVPRGLLNEILADGTCPLHLRVQLQHMTQQQAVKQAQLDRKDAQAAEPPKGDEDKTLEVEAEDTCAMSRVSGPCLTLVATHLPLAEVLAVRATSTGGLEWAMQRSASALGELQQVHDRIRTRLWIERVADLTRETADETVFETKVRSLANDVLRRRMEAEMAETKLHMERQIHAFQGEVDRRMEEQATRVHAIVEERVQQQLDATLAAEMERVRATVEDRVRAVVQREVCATVCEVQARLAALARENDRLRDAFVDHSDLCVRSLVWALSPNATGIFARTLRTVWYCRRRARQLSGWVFGIPLEKKRERLRLRLEAARCAEVHGECARPCLVQGLAPADAEALEAAAPAVAEVNDEADGSEVRTALMEHLDDAGAGIAQEAPLGEEPELSLEHPAASREVANASHREVGEALRRGDDGEDFEDDDDVESNSPVRLSEPPSADEEAEEDEEEDEFFDEQEMRDEHEEFATEAAEEMIEEQCNSERLEEQGQSCVLSESVHWSQTEQRESRTQDQGTSAADADLACIQHLLDINGQQVVGEAVPPSALDQTGGGEDKFEDAEEGAEPCARETDDRTERRPEERGGADHADVFLDAEGGGSEEEQEEEPSPPSGTRLTQTCRASR